MRERFDFRTEFSLALLPTLSMAGVLLLLEAYGKQHLLFASLASSAFLIYLDPEHPTNSIYVLIMAQVSAALIGTGVIMLMGPGYASAITAMVLSITFMILLNVMHPPAVSTALTFAFSAGKTMPLFLIGVGILALLVVLQRVSTWLVKRYKLKQPTPPKPKIA